MHEDEDDNDGGEDGGSGMITDHASIVFANGGAVSAPNRPLPRCLKPFLKPALHNMSLFAPPLPFYHASSMFASGGGGVRPTNPPLVQACLTACELFYETNHASIVFANGGGGLRTPPLF